MFGRISDFVLSEIFLWGGPNPEGLPGSRKNVKEGLFGGDQYFEMRSDVDVLRPGQGCVWGGDLREWVIEERKFIRSLSNLLCKCALGCCTPTIFLLILDVILVFFVN